MLSPEILGRDVRRSRPTPSSRASRSRAWATTRRRTRARSTARTSCRWRRGCSGSRRRPPISWCVTPRRRPPSRTCRPGSRSQLDAELADDVDRRGAVDGLRRLPAPRDDARRGARPRRARRWRTSSPRSPRSPRRASSWRVAMRPAARRFAVVGLGKLGGAELNYASDVDLLFSARGRRSDGGRTRGRAGLIALLAEPTAEGIALRVDPTLRPGGRGGALSPDARTPRSTYYETRSATWERQAMIKARGVAGDPWLGSAFVDGVAPFVYPAHAGARSDRRGPAHQGPPGGVHPPARQGAHRGQARARRDPRRGVRGAAAADRARPARRRAARAQHAARARRARRRGLRGQRRRRGAGRCLPVPAPAGAPAADRARPADPRPARRPARPHDDRALARSGRRRRAAGASTNGPPARSARSTSGSSTGRCWRRSPDRPRRRRASIEPRPRSCSAGSGSPSRPVPTRCSRRLVDPATRMGKVLTNVFPVMAPAAGARRRTPTARSCAWNASPTRWARPHGPADVLAADPGRGPPARRSRGRELVRDRPAGRRPRPARRPLGDSPWAESRTDARARRPGRRGRARRRTRDSSRTRPARRSPTSPSAWSARRSRRPNPTCRSP